MQLQHGWGDDHLPDDTDALKAALTETRAKLVGRDRDHAGIGRWPKAALQPLVTQLGMQAFPPLRRSLSA
jgi:hypothetical protein